MKKLFAIVFSLALLQSAQAAAYLEEHFSYGSGNLGTVGASGGWSGSNSGVTVTTNSLADTALGLAASVSNKVTTTTSSSSGTYNQFSSGILTDVYCSFLLRVNSTAGLDSNGRIVAGLLRAGSSSSYYADGWLRLNGANVEIGLSKLRAGTTWHGTPLAVGNTCLVVVKYHFVAGSNNDGVSLWVNPASLGGSEPAADVSFATGSDGNNSTGIGRCYLYGGADVAIDELRTGPTWADVTPINGAPPTTGVPHIIQVSVTTEGVVLRGTNGSGNLVYGVLTSTNLTLPLSQWTLLATNAFAGDGYFACTNPLQSGSPQRFYRLQVGNLPSFPPTAPAITNQPQGQTVAAGGTAVFSVGATGTAPLSYRWYFNTNTPLVNGTNASLTLTNVQSGDAGGYSVVITNAAGSITSVVAVLTVTNLVAAPTITTQPQNQTVTEGQAAHFSIVATGTAPLQYQWYFNTSTPLTDATNSTLTLSSVSTNDAGGYSAMVSNSFGSTNSAEATLTVNPPSTNAGPAQILEAENGAFTGSVSTEYTGYTGSGFVDTVNATGSYVEIEFGRQQAGTEMMSLRYAQGKMDNRTASVTLNGVVVVSSIDFPPTGSFTSWQVVSNAIPVAAGRNVLRLMALTSGGLANLDHFEISGDPQYKVNVGLNGNGTVTLNPSNTFAYYDPGTLVTLTATSPTGSVFTAWSGDLNSTNNPETLTVDANKSVTATFTAYLHFPMYVSPTGGDSNPGTIDQPFYSLSKAVSNAVAGDSIYLRGGTFSYSATVTIDKPGTSNSPISILAYPGEKPVLDYSLWVPPNETIRGGARGIHITTNAQYWVLKGLEIQYAPDNGIKCEGGHITFDICVFHHNGDGGLQIGLNKDTLSSNPDPERCAAYCYVLNCDAYRNADPATSYENADGFSCKLYAGKGNHFYGCRAWENCDDGWDCYQTGFEIVIENCWSWHNGDPSLWGFSSFNGDGNGFKLGGDNTYCPILIQNCVALNCQWGTTVGFAYNNNTAPITLYNCAALNCGRPYKFGEDGNVFKNCLDFNSARPAPVDITGTSTQQNNSWNLGITVTTSDYVSMSETDAVAPRQADGSLPNNGFGRLKSTSNLIDRGVDVGLPYSGAAPDLGAYEYAP